MRLNLVLKVAAQYIGNTCAKFCLPIWNCVHRGYGHQSAESILSALREAGYEDLPSDTNFPTSHGSMTLSNTGNKELDISRQSQVARFTFQPCCHRRRRTF